jgi:hypothetical protein
LKVALHEPGKRTLIDPTASSGEPHEHEKQTMKKQSDPPTRGPGSDLPRPVVRCLVCLKQINEGESHASVYHAGASYPVCCASCAAKFEEDPCLYLVM